MASEPLQFGGVEHFTASSERVFDVVTDLATLARILPDVESSEQPDANTLRCVVRPGFSFIRGKLNVTITRHSTDAAADTATSSDAANASQPLSASYRVVSKAIGVQITVETSLRVGAASDPTAQSALHWQAVVTERKGLVAAVSTALIRAAAEKVIQQTWQRLGEELGA